MSVGAHGQTGVVLWLLTPPVVYSVVPVLPAMPMTYSVGITLYSAKLVQGGYCCIIQGWYHCIV